MSSVTATITARWNGGQRPGPPTFGVLHDAETPLEPGYARAIGNMFATTATQKSATYMVDPVDTVQLLDESLIAWHCGNANPRSIGVEQSGYARFTEADWSTAAALQQEERVAQLMREIQGRHGIGLYWMTDQQLRDAHAGRIVGGWATHDQCSRVIGGSTHTDPAPNYPLARLMARANTNVQEDDMPLFDLQARTELAATNDNVNAIRAYLGVMEAHILAADSSNALDEDAIVKRVVEALTPAVVTALGSDHGIDAAEVEAAVRKVFADAAS